MLDGYKTYPGPGQRKKSNSPKPLDGPAGYLYRLPPGRDLPRPPPVPPPDYQEAISRSRNTFGRPVTRHQSAREPMVSLAWREGDNTPDRDSRLDIHTLALASFTLCPCLGLILEPL